MFLNFPTHITAQIRLFANGGKASETAYKTIRTHFS